MEDKVEDLNQQSVEGSTPHQAQVSPPLSIKPKKLKFKLLILLAALLIIIPIIFIFKNVVVVALGLSPSQKGLTIPSTTQPAISPSPIPNMPTITPGVAKIFDPGGFKKKFTFSYPDTIKEGQEAGVFYPIEADPSKDPGGFGRVLETSWYPKTENSTEKFDSEKSKPTTKQLTVDGYPAIRYQGNLYENQVSVRSLDIIKINKDGEIVTLSNLNADQEKWKNLLDQIIPTFKFLE